MLRPVPTTAGVGGLVRPPLDPSVVPIRGTMPEGHTLHRWANDVRGAFGGGTVRASSPQGRFAEGAALLDGQLLRQTEAHGKHFLADFEGAGWLHIHLGLIGKMDIRPA